MESLREVMDLSAFTDDDLMGWIATGGEDQTRANSAWAELYERHVNYLLHIGRLRWGSVLDVEVEDAVQETFRRAHRYARTYKPSGSEDPQRARRHTRAWLGTIMNNECRRILGMRGKANLGLEEFAPPLIDDDSSAPASPLRRAFLQAWTELPERTRDVLRVTGLHIDLNSTKHPRLPNRVAQDLARRWDTTTTNLRAIRKRGTNQLRQRTEELLAMEASNGG